MITQSQISPLPAEIAATEDEAAIVDLLLRDADLIAALPPCERERTNEIITDAVREWREARAGRS